MSVKEWGLTFTTSNNVSYPLDYTVYMESISFPPVNETRDTFVTIEPLQRHIDEDGNLNADLYFDEAGNFLGVLGLELDFPRYVKQEYGASTSFNHLHLVTGDNIVDNYYTWFENGTVELIGRYPGVIGIAGGIGALCENYEMSEYDFRVSFNEFYSAAFVNLLAHELGHNAGSWHDTSTRCPASDSYIMAPSLSPKLTTISSNYYKFSLCSAEYFASYLSRFTSEEIASCIYTEHPTKEEFLSTFCRGIEGFTYTPDAHCKLFFGANSYVCTEGSDLLANGYVHGKSCETYIEDLSFVPIFRCAMNNDCIDTPNKITHVFDGTKCSNNKPKGKKVCYEGKCQSKIKICKNKQQTSKKKSSGKR
ncbi:uncharacterized protein LOC123530774 [Mercenaria mercenaria]|uniref:uncharacterized protein LOC123530774 n=1 Tax=Mercenaria mercenaria TaxID=6596 RepID=UPI00234E4498|nr:uncharacterized protein LOC123530774 [Mercenaria mercenaria]